MTKRFSGWHMTGILVGGFGVVIAVNLLMASFAVGSFGGVVVDNSYVASQKFNDWLAEAERQNHLGWTARMGRDGDGRLIVATQGVPPTARARVVLRHPLGKTETMEFDLVPNGAGRYVSPERLPEGRWLARLELQNGADTMRIERPLG